MTPRDALENLEYYPLQTEYEMDKMRMAIQLLIAEALLEIARLFAIERDNTDGI